MDCVEVAEIVADSLKDVLGEDGFDVIPGPIGAFVDIAADEWTLQIEGSPVAMAWLSLEDEPEQPHELPAARRAVMSTAVDNALVEADKRLGGALSTALRTSGDPLTLDLVAAITR